MDRLWNLKFTTKSVEGTITRRRRRYPRRRPKGGGGMKIVAVCGMGLGSSLVLRMSIDEVLEEMEVDAEVQVVDISAAHSVEGDLFVTSSELADRLDRRDEPVIVITNMLNKQEVKGKIADFLDDRQS